jgi:pSer/pThr/pTyr-binding forkhead associated (FHA) protein
MPRFQLLVRELGKAPRTVALAQTLVVGRSRRADIVLEDEEVGREQFRIGPAGASVAVEGIGSTNKTIVDGSSLEPGQKVTIGSGATIKVGRSILQLLLADATESAPARPGNFDATLVAGRPAVGGPMELPPEERTDNLQRPGPQKAPAAEDFGQTMNVPGAFRPGQPGPTKPPAPAAGTAKGKEPPPNDGNWGQTINVSGGYRPGQGGTPPANVPPPAAPGANKPATAGGNGDGNWGQTIDVSKGFRPGQGGAVPPPAAPSTPPPAAESAPPAPGSPLPAPPTPPPAAGTPERPKTVMLDPNALAAAPSNLTPVVAVDIESKLHQAMPRVFVKGENVKRKVRLMKQKSKLGRAETSDVLLPHESVSELHAEIEFNGATWSLRDCGSTNGTLVDGNVLRGQSRPIGRNSLLGFGSLRGLFVCVDSATNTDDRRQEERALQLLVKAGRLGKDVANQVLAMARADTTQTIGEVLLLDTPLEPADWANAITAVRARVTLWDRLRRLFTKPRKPAQ